MKNILVLVLLTTTFAVGQNVKTNVPPSARYQLINLGKGDMPFITTLLLDTQTGKTWQLVSAPDGRSFWEPQDKVDTHDEEVTYLHHHQKSATDDAEAPKR